MLFNNNIFIKQAQMFQSKRLHSIEKHSHKKGSEIILDVFNKLLFWSQENKIVVSFTIFYIDFENSLQMIKDLEKEC